MGARGAPREGAFAVAGCGLSGVALNLLAVGLLFGQPHAYKPGSLEGWRLEALAQPLATFWSAEAFVFGLSLLAVFAACLGSVLAFDRPTLARVGLWAFAIGAALDAAGCVTPLVLTRLGGAPGAESAVLGQALLGITLGLDAVFNGLLGVGLLLINVAAGEALPRWVRAVGLAAGVASLPLVFQVLSDGAARWLALSGPLWSLWVGAVSLRLLFPSAPRSRVAGSG